MKISRALLKQIATSLSEAKSRILIPKRGIMVLHDKQISDDEIIVNYLNKHKYDFNDLEVAEIKMLMASDEIESDNFFTIRYGVRPAKREVRITRGKGGNRDTRAR